MNDFWTSKTLDAMSPDEWESLCDGCALCCLVKVEDEENGEIFNTTVSCRQLGVDSCRCKDYRNRLDDVPMCIQLTMENLPQLAWLPETCAYRCLYNGRPLPSWHPLVTGDKNSVHEAGISARWFAQSEEYVHPEQLVQFIIEPEIDK
ncbi:MAG TPA: YcgN family cysteine cluster protein [Gammaproteobacteria bacterium]|nr:YcgN family cysteine cluster protein [Gammaproteobacteria bacterium]